MRTEFVVKDLTAAPESKWFKFFDRWAEKAVYDPRDVYLARFAFKLFLNVVPFALFLFFYFHWALALLYWANLFLRFVHTYTLTLHHVSHRTLFKSPSFLNHLLPGVMGPFMGQPPNGYYGHHIGMHHPENNLETDLSSTMKYERDNAFHWLRYYLRFTFGVLFELTFYLWRHGRKRLAVNALVGELAFYAVLAALFFLNWQATLTVFLVPYVIVRAAMMMGNWGQHAFVDAAHPENPHINSITCINNTYNLTGLNDGYHIGHHVKANRHWTELPGDFLANKDKYAADGAIVFEGIDFFHVWAFLMLRRYDWLLEHYVCLDGKERSKEEVLALLKLRTRPIHRDLPQALPAAG